MRGTTTIIPLVVLLLIALTAGCIAGLLASRYPGPPTSVVAAARDEARRHPGWRERMSSRIDPSAATGLALTLALAMIFLGGIVLAALAFIVRDSHALSGIDTGAADWGAQHATAWSTSGLKLVTDLGETWMVIAAGVVIALVDLRRTRNRWVVPFLVAVVAGDKLLTNGLKGLVDRVRPDLNTAAATLGPSFPSGHSSTAAAFWAAIALIVIRWWGRRALGAVVGAAVAIAIGVAASRVLLDVHWLTDVVAGLILGWAWFATCAVAFGGRVLRFGAPAEAAQAAAQESVGGGVARRPSKAATPIDVT